MNNNNLISLNEDPINLFAKWYEEAKSNALANSIFVLVGA